MASADEVIISVAPGETRLALLAAGEPVQFVIDRGDSAPGDVLLGRVTGVNRALDAAFVDIGEPQPGFLQAPRGLSEGDQALVQVTSAARPGKGASLTAAPSLAGRFLAYSPRRAGLNLSRRIGDDEVRARLSRLLKPAMAAGEGLVARTASAGAADEALLAELVSLREAWQAIEAAAGKAVAPARLHAPPPLSALLAENPGIKRVSVDDPASLSETRLLFPSAQLDRDAFEASGAAEALDEALQHRVGLPGGGALIIEAAAGLTVIDVDSGGGSALDANLAAVPQIARQLRLRSLAGHIMVDIIPLRDRASLAKLVEALRKAVAEDPTPTQVVGSTPLGMIEVTRDRRRPSLAETMLAGAEPRWNAESIGLDALRALMRASTARPEVPFGLAARPEVLAALRRRPMALAEATRRLGRPLVLHDDPRVEFYEVVEERR